MKKTLFCSLFLASTLGSFGATPIINLIAGTNVTILTTNRPGGTGVDVQINSTTLDYTTIGAIAQSNDNVYTLPLAYTSDTNVLLGSLNYVNGLFGQQQTGVYVDPIYGDDGSLGGLGNPVRTLKRATQLSSTIFLRAGRVFREDFQLPDNCVVKKYGDGVNPIVSGADLLTNNLFTLAPTTTNVYVYSIAPPPHTNNMGLLPLINTNVLKVWDNDTRLLGGYGAQGTAYQNTNAFFSNLVNVAKVPGSFWYDSSNHNLYVHLRDSANPNTVGRTLESSTRTLAIYGGDAVYVEDLIGEKSYVVDGTGSQGYGVLAYKSGTFLRCTGRYGWNHNVGVANYVIMDTGTTLKFDSCVAYDCEEQIISYPTMFVAFKQTVPASVNNVIFTNCFAIQPGTLSPYPIAYLAHGDHVAAWVDNCSAANVGIGFTLDSALRNRGFGLYATNCYYGARITAAPGLTNAVFSGATLLIRTTNGYFRDIEFRNANYLTWHDMDYGATTNHFDTCTFVKDNGWAFSKAFQLTNNNFITVSNSKFANLDEVFTVDTTAYNPVKYAENNTYYNSTSIASGFAEGATSWATFGLWHAEAAHASWDQTSVTTSFTYAPTLLKTIIPSARQGLLLEGSNVTSWAQLGFLGYFPTNTQLPNGRQLGVGGTWLGNSNGSLVVLFSADGTNRIMKVLYP